MWFRETVFDLCPFREKQGPKRTKTDFGPLAIQKQFSKISHLVEFEALNWF